MKQIKLKLNRDIKDHKKGEVLTLLAHKDSQPLDRYWRARLKDSILDNCCEIVKNKKKAPAKQKPKKETEE